MSPVLWTLSVVIGLPPFAVAAPPSDSALIYYNARMALREEAPAEAVSLWFLRSALENQTGQVSVYDADFHSVTWAALSQLGVCPDGLKRDHSGAGLWPVALHNYVIRTSSRRTPPDLPKTFDTFEVGQQQRPVSINDVLDTAELDTLRRRFRTSHSLF